MTRVLDLIELYCDYAGFKFLRLDGSNTNIDRKAALTAFNAPNSDVFIFLLSTRAGGLGLNLQTADTVIIFDSDWNPQADLQAQDRAHRIGQQREVKVLRFITISPVEEQILARARFKLGIDSAVIQSGRFNARATDEERRELLADALKMSVYQDEESREAATSDEELNLMMARSEAEVELYNKMDAELDARDRQEWDSYAHTLSQPQRSGSETSNGTSSKKRRKSKQRNNNASPSPATEAAFTRLITNEEVEALPAIAADLGIDGDDDGAPKVLKVVEPEIDPQTGRKRRSTKPSFFGQVLTDREYLDCVDRGEDPEEYAAIKMAMLEEQKAAKRAGRSKSDNNLTVKGSKLRLSLKKRKQSDNSVVVLSDKSETDDELDDLPNGFAVPDDVYEPNGRPSKRQSLKQSASQTTLTDAPVKRGRGRPKKQKLDQPTPAASPSSATSAATPLTANSTEPAVDWSKVASTLTENELIVGDKVQRLDDVRCEACQIVREPEDDPVLCDGCNRAYHLECMTPPRTDLPDGEWFCPRCLPAVLWNLQQIGHKPTKLEKLEQVT